MQAAPSFLAAVDAVGAWLRPSVLALIAVGVVACGGGSSGDDDPAAGPGPGPGPAAVVFQVMPSRLPLASGGAGRLVALQASGTIACNLETLESTLLEAICGCVALISNLPSRPAVSS